VQSFALKFQAIAEKLQSRELLFVAPGRKCEIDFGRVRDMALTLLTL